MKNNFKHCIPLILSYEGGFVNHPKDPGGATNYGITRATLSRFLDREVDVQDVKDLDVETAKDIYHYMYWNQVKGDCLPLGVDLFVFDCAVNHGPGRAGKFLQQAIGAHVDGIIGPETVKVCLYADVTQALKDMHKQREIFYKSLNTFKTFGKGWLKRNNHVFAEALTMAKK